MQNASDALLISQTNAAWFQAWGSIAAIVFSGVIGVGVVLVQHRLERRENKRQAAERLVSKRQDARELLRAIRLASEACARTVNNTGVGNQVGPWRLFAQANVVGMRYLRRVAEAIDLNEIASARIRLSWSLLLREMDQVADALQDQIDWCDVTTDKSAIPEHNERLRVLAAYQSLASTCEGTDAIFEEDEAEQLGLEAVKARDLERILRQLDKQAGVPN